MWLFLMLASAWLAAGNTVVTVKQTNPACPSVRSCPGRVGTSELCRSFRENLLFDCDLSWSNGFSGRPSADMTRVYGHVSETFERACGGCARSLTYSATDDVDVELADPEILERH
jgi:hypothetical protein